MVWLRPAESAVGTVRGLTVSECVWALVGWPPVARLDPKVPLSPDYSPLALHCARPPRTGAVWVTQLVRGFNPPLSRRAPGELKVTRAVGSRAR